MRRDFRLEKPCQYTALPKKITKLLLAKSYIIISQNYFSNSYQHFQQGFQHFIFIDISRKIAAMLKSQHHGNHKLITKEKQKNVDIM